jgi:hypothetical protein
MIRNKSTRVLATLGVTVSLALTAIAGPALVSAAPAPKPTPTVTAIPAQVDPPNATIAQVAPDRAGAFDLSFTNSTPSNYSQFFLNAVTNPPPSTGLDYAGVLGVPTITPAGGDPIELPTACSGTNEPNLSCTFGALNSGSTVSLRVLYDTLPEATGLHAINFVFSSTGVPSDPKGRSHGDDFAKTGTISINSDNTKFDGGYFQAPAGVATNPAVTRQNPQSTAVPAFNAFTSGPLTVQEVPGNTYACPDEVIALGGTCRGEWSIINVNGGEPFAGGFEIQIRLDGSVTGGNIQSLKFAHVLDDLTVKLITATCSDLTPDPSEMDPGCKIIESLGGGDALVHLFVLENGRARTF